MKSGVSNAIGIHARAQSRLNHNSRLPRDAHVMRRIKIQADGLLVLFLLMHTLSLSLPYAFPLKSVTLQLN